MDFFDSQTGFSPNPSAGTSDTHGTSPAPVESGRAVISVTELNSTARQVLERAFGTVWVEGELSNVSRPRSGHLYFSLKDGSAQVRCAMFRGRNRYLDFEPENGGQVVVRAKVGFYEARGEFQLVVDNMEEAGSGALQRAFDQLKRRLEAEGLFAPEGKQDLPRLPNRVGVVTSATGAAFRDILTVLQNRFPAIEVILYPVPVQGDEAASAISRMLELAGRRNEVDVLIVGRGGGSLEDLWAFNEETVARAIAASPIPVVAAVGHETDVTIADFVADHRAATPSAAAERVSPDGKVWLGQVNAARRRLLATQSRHLQQLAQRSQTLRRRLRDPRRRLQDQAQRLDELEGRLRRSIHSTLAGAKRTLHHQRQRLADPRRQLGHHSQRLEQLHNRLHRGLHQQLRQQQQRHALARHRLEALSPERVLERGFAIIEDAHGQVIRQPGEAPVGSRLNARLASGALTVDVVATHSDSTSET